MAWNIEDLFEFDQALLDSIARWLMLCWIPVALHNHEISFSTGLEVPFRPAAYHLGRLHVPHILDVKH